MYYLKRENDFVVKYDVSVDTERLKKLRKEIIERCSHIKHMSYKTTQTPFRKENIRNYKETYIRTIEYNDYYSQDEDEYLVEYDYYEYSHLVSLIDLLISGDVSVISEIEAFCEEKTDDEERILGSIRNILEEICNYPDDDITEKLKVLNDKRGELLHYREDERLNKGQISAELYKDEVLGCVTFSEVSRLSMRVIYEVQNFLENNIEDLLDSKLNIKKKV